MFLRHFGKQGFVSLLVIVSLILLGGSAWATHDCCGHSSASNPTADSGTQKSSSGGDCVCPSCQADTGISLLPGISFQFDPLWSVGTTKEFAASRAETDIFRPPLA